MASFDTVVNGNYDSSEAGTRLPGLVLRHSEQGLESLDILEYQKTSLRIIDIQCIRPFHAQLSESCKSLIK